MPVGYTPVEFDGQVTKRTTAAGSKSERRGLFLETEGGSFALRRRGGNPFFDPVLEKLVGKQIRCKGVLTEHTLIISEWDELEHTPPEHSK